SRGWPRVEGLGREASLPSLAFWELFLHRKSSPRGVGNGVSPHYGRGRRRRLKGTLPKDYRFPPTRVSHCEEGRRGGAPPQKGVWGNPPHNRQAARRAARQKGGEAAHLRPWQRTTGSHPPA